MNRGHGNRRNLRPGWWCAIIAAMLSCRCGEPVEIAPAGPPRSAGEASLRLFALSPSIDPELRELAELLDESSVEEDRAAALDAVASLRNASRPSILAEGFLDVLDRAVVDIEAELPGGGTARFSFQARQLADGSWRVVSIEAPGVEWPGRGRKGSGLTVSAPAEESTR
jgi:hypothetical protein